MSPSCVAVVPAKSLSRRVPAKNTRPFWNGMSLLEIKVRALQRCTSVGRIIVSSNNTGVLELARALGVEAIPRDEELCGDTVSLGALFGTVLAEVADELIYWAHTTSPFVEPRTIDRATALAIARPGACIVGVERLFEFLLDESGPANYKASTQPRSQDLPPLWRVTGGVHMAAGQDLISAQALIFDPVVRFELTKTESLDINQPDDWELCSIVADRILPTILE